MNFAIQKSGDDDIWVDMITKEIITWVEIAMLPNEEEKSLSNMSH